MKAYVAIVILYVIGTKLKSIDCGKKLDIDGMKDMLKPMSKSCKTKTGFSNELLAGTLRGLWPRERPLMCYFKCLGTMLKFINKQGELSLREVYKSLDTLVVEDLVPRVKKVLQDCLDKSLLSEIYHLFGNFTYEVASLLSMRRRFRKFAIIDEYLGLYNVYFAPKSADLCEYCFDMILCAYNTDPSLYFLPS